MIITVLFVLFIISLVLFICIAIHEMVLNLRAPIVPENFNTIPSHQVARLLIKLLERGYFRKHILRNRGVPHDDTEHVKNYEEILKEEVILEIKNLKGLPYYG